MDCKADLFLGRSSELTKLVDGSGAGLDGWI